MSSDRRGKYGESESTKVKLGIFRDLITMHVGICAGQKWCRSYAYIDMNAGPGIAPECQLRGSPLLFLDAIKEQLKPLNYAALMIDSNPAYAAELRSRLAGYPRVHVEHGDHCVVAPRDIALLNHRPHGLIYHDPNGIPSWETLAAIFALPQARYLDLLMYVRLNDLNRVNSLRYNRKLPDFTLTEGLAAIKKQTLIIREPARPTNWTYLIATNWTGFPVWYRKGFHLLTSREGQAILMRHSFRPRQPPEADQQSFTFEI